jgi:hypothetical protein
MLPGPPPMLPGPPPMLPGPPPSLAPAAAQKVQEHVFRRWTNWYLSTQERNVSGAVSEWFHDGTLLCYFIEEIGKSKMIDIMDGKTFFPHPKDRAEKSTNVRLVFEYCRKKGLNISNIKPTDIIDGKEYAILRFLWQVNMGFPRVPKSICDHAINEENGNQLLKHTVLGTSQRILMKWCQDTVQNESNVSLTGSNNTFSKVF